MPKIFSDTDRTNIRESLLVIGRKALEKNSYKNISVADIATDAGIAKGTFYNFFPSKEVFFYEIMLQIRDENRMAFAELIESPTRENAYNLFYEPDKPRQRIQIKCILQEQPVTDTHFLVQEYHQS